MTVSNCDERSEQIGGYARTRQHRGEPVNVSVQHVHQ